MAKIELKFCVVCGAGSHREDWQSKTSPACDSHSAAEVQAAIASRPGPQPVGGTKIPPVTTAKA